MTTSLLARPPADRPARPIALVEPTKQGWFKDPMGLHRFRFYDGHEWTEHATHFGPVPCLGCR